MHAIILAAGRGTRLAEHNPDDRPKCLLRFGGQALLDRQLAALERFGVQRALVVTGHREADIQAHLEAHPSPVAVSTVSNPRYTEGSIISMQAGLEHAPEEQPVLLLDADVLCHPEIYGRLTHSGHDNALLLDRHFEPGLEPVKVCLRAGRIVEFRKQVSQHLRYDVVGESVGFFRLSAAAVADLLHRAEDYDRAGRADAPHEEALRDLMLAGEHAFGVEDVTGLPWIEIDFPGDVVRASEDVLPAIRSAA